MIKKAILAITTIGFLCMNFSCTRSKTMYDIKPVFTDMRDMTFSIDPSELNLSKEFDNQVYAVIMETGYEEAVFSLRCIAEGSISIYFSNGGGMIGIGEHEDAKEKGLLLIDESNQYLKNFTKVEKYPLPQPGETIFYLLTFDGIYSFSDKEVNLMNNKSELSPLFNSAQDVITQARLIREKQQ